jgi:hypothetical protein
MANLEHDPHLPLLAAEQGGRLGRLLLRWEPEHHLRARRGAVRARGVGVCCGYVAASRFLPRVAKKASPRAATLAARIAAAVMGRGGAARAADKGGGEAGDAG